MFHPTSGGSYEIVGEHYKCWIPPKPPHNQIEGWNRKKEDQFWRRQPLPDFWNERYPEEQYRREEQQKQVDEGKIKKVTYVDPILERYRREEWKRRYNGFWFYNNGVPTYITGGCYFYLQWNKFDHEENDGYPVYYDELRRRFFFYAYCEEDPNCFGYVVGGPRAYGKTNEVTSRVLDRATRPPYRKRFAIQSKTDEDSEMVFTSKFVPCFNALPPFFKPVSSHSSKAAKSLDFFRLAKRGQKAKGVEYGNELELENTIFYTNAGEKALDGDTLRDIIEDESGKLLTADAYERNRVNLKCVHRNQKKVGFIRCVSSVEDMDYTSTTRKGVFGGEAFRKLWNESDPRNRNDNGRTLSWMYRYFQPKSRVSNQYADKYGVIDLKKALQEEINERKAREHDFLAYSSYIRKNPETEEEMFIRDAKNTTFNTLKISKYQTALRELGRKITVRGNLEWSGGKDTPVYFDRDDHAGRWTFSFLLDADGAPYMEYAKTKLANNITRETDIDGVKQYRPKNNRLFALGVDPIKNRKTDDPRASNMSFHALYKFDPNVDSAETPVADMKSFKVFMKYNARPEDPIEAYEDLIKTLRYLGCSAHIEDNVSDCKGHLMKRGYGRFVTTKRQIEDPALQKSNRGDDEPFTGSEEVRSTYINRIRTFISKYFGQRIDCLPFEDTLTQLHDYDVKNPTRFDDVASLGFMFIANEMRVEEEYIEEDIGEWVDIYDQAGTQSQLVEEFSIQDLL